MTVTPIASIIEADVAEQEYDLVAAAAAPTQTQLHQAIIAHRNEPDYTEASTDDEHPWMFGGVTQSGNLHGVAIYPLSSTQTLILFKDRNSGPGSAHYHYYIQIATKDAALGITKMGAPYYVGYNTSAVVYSRFTKLKDGKFLLSVPGGDEVACYTYSQTTGYISLLSNIDVFAAIGVAVAFPGYITCRVDDDTALCFLANGGATMAARQLTFNDDGTTAITGSNPTGLPNPTLYSSAFRAMRVTDTTYVMSYYTTNTNWRIHTFTYDKATDTITSGVIRDETVDAANTQSNRIFSVSNDGTTFDVVAALGTSGTTMTFIRYPDEDLNTGRATFAKTVTGSASYEQVEYCMDYGGNYLFGFSYSSSGYNNHVVGIPASGSLSDTVEFSSSMTWRLTVPVGDWLYLFSVPPSNVSYANFISRYTLGTAGSALTARNADSDTPTFMGTNPNAAYFDPNIGDGGRYVVVCWGALALYKKDGTCDGFMWMDAGSGHGARAICASSDTVGNICVAYASSTLLTYDTVHLADVRVTPGDFTQTRSSNVNLTRTMNWSSGIIIAAIAPLDSNNRYCFAGGNYTGNYYSMIGHFQFVDGDTGNSNLYYESSAIQGSGSVTPLNHYAVLPISDVKYIGICPDNSSSYFIRQHQWTSSTGSTNSWPAPVTGSVAFSDVTNEGHGSASMWQHGTQVFVANVGGLIFFSDIKERKYAVYNRIPEGIGGGMGNTPKSASFCTDQFLGSITCNHEPGYGGQVLIVDHRDFSTRIVDLTSLGSNATIPVYSDGLAGSAYIIPHSTRGYQYRHIDTETEASVFWPGAVDTTYTITLTADGDTKNLNFLTDQPLLVGEVQVLDLKPFSIAPDEKVKITPADSRQIYCHVTKIERT